MFGLSLNSHKKKLLEVVASPQTPLGSESLQRITGPYSRIEPLGASTQWRPRHPRQCKMRHRNPRGRQNKDVGGQSLNLVS